MMGNKIFFLILLLQPLAFANDTYLGRGIFNESKAEAVYLVCKAPGEHSGCSSYQFYRCNFGLTSYKELKGNIENNCDPQAINQNPFSKTEVQTIENKTKDWDSALIQKKIEDAQKELDDPLKFTKAVWTGDTRWVAPTIEAAAVTVAGGYTIALADYQKGPKSVEDPIDQLQTAGTTAIGPNNLSYYTSMTLLQWAQYYDASSHGYAVTTPYNGYNVATASQLLAGSSIRTIQQAINYFNSNPNVFALASNTDLNAQWSAYQNSIGSYSKYLNKAALWKSRIPQTTKNTKITWGFAGGTLFAEGGVPLLSDGGRNAWNKIKEISLNAKAKKEKHAVEVAWAAVRYEQLEKVITFKNLLHVDDEVFNAILSAIDQPTAEDFEFYEPSTAGLTDPR